MNPTCERPNLTRRKPMLALLCLGLAGLLASGGCARQQSLTVRAYIDGSDVVKVRGDKLWIEHDTASLPGKLIYVNGQAWTPAWKDKVSTEFSGLNPPLRLKFGQKIQLTKRAGRGVVSIQEFPNAENDQTLSVRIDDDEFGGADWYEIVVSWP